MKKRRFGRCAFSELHPLACQSVEGRAQNMSTNYRTQARRNPYCPRDFFEALRAANRPRTDKENALLRAEIARRYALWKRRQQADRLRFMAANRIEELERVFLDHYGLYLPDDDSGWDDFTIVAHHFAHLRGSEDKIVARIVGWAAIWAPSFATDKVIERAKQAVAMPRKWKADTLARKLGLTMEQRTRLKIKTIGAINVKRKHRPAWLRAYHRQRKEAERRANGVRTREAYLVDSISAGAPWVALGMSRATWYRQGKPMPEPGQALEPLACNPEPTRETGPADYKVYISSAGPVSSTTDRDAEAPQGLDQEQVSLQQHEHAAAKQKRLAEVEPVTTAVPDRPALKRGKGMTVKQNAKVQMMIRQLRLEIAEREATLSDALDRPDDSNRSNAVSKRTTGTFRPRSTASFDREIRQLRHRVIALDQRLKQRIGVAAFAAFEDDFAKQVERQADAVNVVRLRRRVR